MVNDLLIAGGGGVRRGGLGYGTEYHWLRPQTSNTIALCEIVLDRCSELLMGEGCCLMKVFQGVGFDALIHDMRQVFVKVSVRKPAASKSVSKEVYVLGVGYKRHAVIP